jgi:hypothetical protein
MRQGTRETKKQEPADKTAPRGMAPDKAHASREMTGDQRNSETEETFNNSPQNAEAKQTRHSK